MARLSIRITYVSWRDGRPRFNPSPELRAIGFKGRDLRTPAGAWMSAEQALAWSTANETAIAARRAEVARAAAAKRKPQPLKPAAAGGAYISIEALFEMYFRSPRMTGQVVEDGRRRQRPASPKTIKNYRYMAEVLSRFDGDLWTGPVEALTRPAVFDLYERLWTRSGLAMARSVVAVLSTAVTWALKRGRIKLTHNPCLGLGMELPAPRVRALTPAEVRHLVATADRLGRPEIGDAITLGVWTGQRQADRLQLLDVGLVDGRRIFRQGKTGAVVAIPSSPELDARLAAMRARREAWKVQPAGVVVDEKIRKLPVRSTLDPNEVPRQPFKADHYKHVFAAIRDAAAASMPSVLGVHDQDLRDTAVTWLARAGCTIPEICAITGHSAASAHSVLKHYLASHPEMADNAIKKMIGWYDGQGAQG